MDMFMDKLAQKLNAQEIIRANTAAETEEAGRLKDRVAEYNKCLDRLQELVNETAVGLREASGASAAQIQRVVEASLEKIGEIQKGCEELEEKQAARLEEKLATVDENVHKECVKVYRNVQAVVVEESGRQSDAIAALSRQISAVEGRVKRVQWFSLLAMLSSLAALALLIRQALNITLF